MTSPPHACTRSSLGRQLCGVEYIFKLLHIHMLLSSQQSRQLMVAQLRSVAGALQISRESMLGSCRFSLLIGSGWALDKKLAVCYATGRLEYFEERS